MGSVGSSMHVVLAVAQLRSIVLQSAVLYSGVLCSLMYCAEPTCCNHIALWGVLRAVAALLCSCPMCCAVLCCAMLCYAVLYCAMLCYAVLCCAVLCCAVLCCTVLYCAVLCCAVLCCAVLCYCAVRCGECTVAIRRGAGLTTVVPWSAQELQDLLDNASGADTSSKRYLMCAATPTRPHQQEPWTTPSSR